jgi:hypothetical protein
MKFMATNIRNLWAILVTIVFRRIVCYIEILRKVAPLKVCDRKLQQRGLVVNPPGIDSLQKRE